MENNDQKPEAMNRGEFLKTMGMAGLGAVGFIAVAWVLWL